MAKRRNYTISAVIYDYGKAQKLHNIFEYFKTFPFLNSAKEETNT